MYRFIIVEDERLIRQWLSQALDYQALGFELVGLAADGQEGAELITRLEPDLVLTDLNMPVMTGFDMLEATKSVSYEKIILSGYSDFKNAKKAMHYGVYNFLEKPIDRVELKETLLQLRIEWQHRASERVGTRDSLDYIQLPELESQNWAMGIVEWVHAHYQETFTFEEVASAFGYSESYLYKRIKEELGITLKEYLARYRLKKAIELMLKEPHLKVYEISEQVGYSDYNYFSKVFRKHTGLSFTAFKENITQKG